MGTAIHRRKKRSPKKRGHQQHKYEELKVTLTGGHPGNKGATQVEKKNKGANEAHEQGHEEHRRNNEVEEIKPKCRGGKHNSTSSNCSQSHSPKAKKPSRCYVEMTRNKGATETTPKGDDRKR